MRGGSWNNHRDNARCAYRNRNHPDNRNNNLGVRFASTPLWAEARGQSPQVQWRTAERA